MMWLTGAHQILGSRHCGLYLGFATQLISGLFATLSLPGSGENEYVMKGEFEMRIGAFSFV